MKRKAEDRYSAKIERGIKVRHRKKNTLPREKERESERKSETEAGTKT